MFTTDMYEHANALITTIILMTIDSSLFAGAAVILGFWKFGNSLDSSVDHILELDGTRMQRELANMYVIMYYLLFHFENFQLK